MMVPELTEYSSGGAAAFDESRVKANKSIKSLLNILGVVSVF
jgi:hypothetical protein